MTPTALAAGRKYKVQQEGTRLLESGQRLGKLLVVAQVQAHLKMDVGQRIHILKL